MGLLRVAFVVWGGMALGDLEVVGIMFGGESPPPREGHRFPASGSLKNERATRMRLRSEDRKMNRYKLQYIVEYVRRQGESFVDLSELSNVEEILKCFGFLDILQPDEVREVSNELMNLAEAERFKRTHLLKPCV